jgi:hypothetical protein
VNEEVARIQEEAVADKVLGVDLLASRQQLLLVLLVVTDPDVTTEDRDHDQDAEVGLGILELGRVLRKRGRCLAVV